MEKMRLYTAGTADLVFSPCSAKSIASLCMVMMSFMVLSC